MILLSRRRSLFRYSFFFNDPATTEIYTLSLHDALPICEEGGDGAHLLVPGGQQEGRRPAVRFHARRVEAGLRSEEHTSELQSRQYLVCRLLLGKKTTHSTTLYRSKRFSWRERG